VKKIESTFSNLNNPIPQTSSTSVKPNILEPKPKMLLSRQYIAILLTSFTSIEPNILKPSFQMEQCESGYLKVKLAKVSPMPGSSLWEGPTKVQHPPPLRA